MTGKETVFLEVALPVALRRAFDYLPPEAIDLNQLIPGVRVQVPFQSRSLIGVLVAQKAHTKVPYEKLKKAEAILDTQPIFSPDLFSLCKWTADYYHAPLGEVLSTALPAYLRKGKTLNMKSVPSFSSVIDSPLPLNAAQKDALDAISASQGAFQVFLLDGVTGSGKTEVYLHAIELILAKGQQVLVLVPEISLTPQTIARFRRRFSLPIVALHSNLSDRERMDGWMLARDKGASIVIGTRSAIFTPFQDLGLIIVDEEHDSSFKQQDRVRYHARDLAILRAQMNQIPVVLGSATPSLETALNVERTRYVALSLPNRAGSAVLPQFRFIDLRKTTQDNGLSPECLSLIDAHLKDDNQVLLYLNRRGFAPVLYCSSCGWVAECTRCDAKLVYHRAPKRLQCHLCDASHVIPSVCQQCANASLEPIGLGTQRLEQTLKLHFPQIPIIRVDRDSTKRKGEIQQLLHQVEHENRAILLGTQMLAKGHHFPKVTFVGVVDADSGLFSPDFRAVEQMGQLLLQVAGRAGREEKKGLVAIQTRNPEHPLLQTLIHEGYSAFSKNLLNERRGAYLPPFTHCVLFRAEARKEAHAKNFLAALKELKMLPKTIEMFGPVSANHAKRKGLYCQQLLLKGTHRSELKSYLHNLLKKIDTLSGAFPTVRWVVDVDPVEI